MIRQEQEHGNFNSCHLHIIPFLYSFVVGILYFYGVCCLVAHQHSIHMCQPFIHFQFLVISLVNSGRFKYLRCSIDHKICVLNETRHENVRNRAVLLYYSLFRRMCFVLYVILILPIGKKCVDYCCKLRIHGRVLSVVDS
jgi:hypothetical protein